MFFSLLSHYLLLGVALNRTTWLFDVLGKIASADSPDDVSSFYTSRDVDPNVSWAHLAAATRAYTTDFPADVRCGYKACALDSVQLLKFVWWFSKFQIFLPTVWLCICVVGQDLAKQYVSSLAKSSRGRFETFWCFSYPEGIRLNWTLRTWRLLASFRISANLGCCHAAALLLLCTDNFYDGGLR